MENKDEYKTNHIEEVIEQIGTPQDVNDIEWTKFTEFQGSSDRPLKKIQVLSPTRLKNEFATEGTGGQLYVLESSVSLEQSQVHIFNVSDENTLELVNNVYVKNTLGTEIQRPYFFAGYNWNNFSTDGAFLTSAEPEKNGNCRRNSLRAMPKDLNSARSTSCQCGLPLTTRSVERLMLLSSFAIWPTRPRY